MRPDASPSVQCNIRLPVELYDELKARADRDLTTKTAVIIAALRLLLREPK